MIEIVLPSYSPDIVLTSFIIVAFGAFVALMRYADGDRNIKLNFVYGCFITGVLICVLLFIISLFTGHPFPVQIVNISVGAP